MKQCSKCKHTKSLSEFYKNHTCKDGHQSECKNCGDKYQKKYRQSENGRNSRKTSQKRFRMKYPERCKAGDVVKRAIRSDKLPRPITLKCYYCSNKAQEYHHWRGYERKYWLDVISVCIKCHHKYGRKIA